MAITHTVKATFQDGTEIDTFSEWIVTLDMLSPGSAWSLSCWKSKVRQSTWQVLREKAQCGVQVYLSIDDAIQLSGRIEEVEPQHDPDSGTQLVMSGRDLAGPALRWHAKPVSKSNISLEDALVQLFEPIGVSIFPVPAADARAMQSNPRRRRGASRAALSQQIDKFKVQPGETIWEVADRLCRKQGFLIWTAPDPQGQAGIGIVVDRPISSGEASYQLEHIDNGDGTFSGNILRGGLKVQIREIPTEVTVYTHTAGRATQDSRFRAKVENSIGHPLVATDLLPQPVYQRSQKARTVEAARREARAEIAKAMAEFIVYESTVQGHGQEVDGSMRLYAVNTLAHIRDDECEVDEDMVTTRVEFRNTADAGTTTNFRHVPKGAIVVEGDESTGGNSL